VHVGFARVLKVAPVVLHVLATRLFVENRQLLFGIPDDRILEEKHMGFACHTWPVTDKH
jgi:hypothetical protein